MISPDSRGAGFIGFTRRHAFITARKKFKMKITHIVMPIYCNQAGCMDEVDKCTLIFFLVMNVQKSRSKRDQDNVKGMHEIVIKRYSAR